VSAFRTNTRSREEILASLRTYLTGGEAEIVEEDTDAE